jgi:hypothetical protein
MIDATLELEQIFGSDVCCGICGDTGFVWGDPKNGPCGCEEEIFDEGFCDGEGI